MLERFGENGRMITSAAAIAWLLVPIAWQISSALEQSQPWEGSPRTAWGVGWVALAVAAFLTVAYAVGATAVRPRPTRTKLGVGLLALGVAVTVVAPWAMIVWAALFAFGMILLSTGVELRPGAIIIATTMFASVAAYIALAELKVGSVNSFGDYPAAEDTATWIAAIGAALGMVLQARSPAVLSSTGDTH